jgi:hypothetical protein
VPRAYHSRVAHGQGLYTPAISRHRRSSTSLRNYDPYVCHIVCGDTNFTLLLCVCSLPLWHKVRPACLPH